MIFSIRDITIVFDKPANKWFSFVIGQRVWQTGDNEIYRLSFSFYANTWCIIKGPRKQNELLLWVIEYKGEV